MKRIFIAALALAAASAVLTIGASRAADKQVPGEAVGAAKPIIIDVRTPFEYRRGHVTGSTNVPVDQLKERISGVVPNKRAPILVHCQTGGRAAQAKKTLDELGYKDVTDLGGLAHARQVLEKKPGS